MAKMQLIQHNITTLYYPIDDIKAAIDSGFAHALHSDPENAELLRIRERISEHLGMPDALRAYHTKLPSKAKTTKLGVWQRIKRYLLEV